MIIFSLVYDWINKKKKPSLEEQRELKFQECKKMYEEYMLLWNELKELDEKIKKGENNGK